MSKAIKMIELENDAQERKKKSQAMTSILLGFLLGSRDRMKKAAARIASKGLSAHLSMKPMLDAKSTPVDER